MYISIIKGHESLGLLLRSRNMSCEKVLSALLLQRTWRLMSRVWCGLWALTVWAYRTPTLIIVTPLLIVPGYDDHKTIMNCWNIPKTVSQGRRNNKKKKKGLKPKIWLLATERHCCHFITIRLRLFASMTRFLVI